MDGGAAAWAEPRSIQLLQSVCPLEDDGSPDMGPLPVGNWGNADKWIIKEIQIIKVKF